MLSNKNEILHFLTHGKELGGIQLNDKVGTIFEKLGEPEEKAGDEDSGFLFYNNGICFGYIKDEVDELSIYFNRDDKIRFSIDVPLVEEFKYIEEKTAIHQFINILNHAKVSWKSVDEKSISAFSILTSGNVYVVFDLETGELYKMAFMRF